MAPITKRHADILRFVEAYTEAHGYAPTYVEIGEEIGMVKSSISRMVQAMERRGAVKRMGGSRSLHVVKEAEALPEASWSTDRLQKHMHRCMDILNRRESEPSAST